MKNLLVSKVTSAVVLALLFGGCSQATTATITEESPKAFLPTSNLPFEIGTIPDEFTNDKSRLRNSFEDFRVIEGSGQEIDYELMPRGATRIGAQSVFSEKSNRERDSLSLAIDVPSITVHMDQSTMFSTVITLSSWGDKVTALCNGMLIEVSGEAFKVESIWSCDDVKDEVADEDTLLIFGSHLADENGNDEKTRMFKLMAQNTFKVKVVDLSGVEHEFVFDKKDKYQMFQDRLVEAFEAEKAIGLGLGY